MSEEWTDWNGQDNERANADRKPRHKVGIDTISLMDDDELTPSAEEISEGDQMYRQVLHDLDTDRERFIAICLDFGFDKVEIAFMCHIHPSQVTRQTNKMRIKLKEYRTGRTIIGRSRT